MILCILLVGSVFFADLVNAEKPYPDPLAKEKESGINGDSKTGTGVVTAGGDDIPDEAKTPRPLGSRNTDGGTESHSSNSPGNTGDGGSQTPTNQDNSRLGLSPKSKSREDTEGENGPSNSGTEANPGASTPAKTAEGSSQTPAANSNQGDSRLGLSPRSKGKEPSNPPPPSPVTSPTSGSSSDATPNTCAADKVPFSCYDQGKLKDYCTQTLGIVRVISGNQDSGLKRYIVDTTKKANWFEAVGLCLLRNMTLATVESDDDQRALSEVLNNAGGVQNAWLSATDLGKTNQYVWMSTGQPVTWFNWYKGEPNHENSGNQTEHCVEVINYRWKWNDNLCNNEEYFICQYYTDN